MVDKLRQIWKAREIRESVLFVLAMLFIYRLAAHLPIPGVDTAALRDFFNSNQTLGMLNLLSGGGMENFSIVMMGVAPFITSSIIFQLLGMIVPKFEEMNKEESGRQKINMWSRWLTVPLSMLQSFSMISLLKSQGVLNSLTTMDIFTAVMTITAGTIFVMWLGEMITEKKVGNGISLMIFAGIVAGIPTGLGNLLSISSNDGSFWLTAISFIAVAVATVVGVVIINEGQRNIPVQYARQIRGNRAFGGASSHLPLRVNMAGVMPIIFAVSIVMFPQMIAQFFVKAEKMPWLAASARWLIEALSNGWVYGILFFVLVFAFAYFYTEVIFHPKQIAENLQKQGGFIPGIRPGRPTADYLYTTANKVIFSGALSLAILAVMPQVVTGLTGVTALKLGGTGILIVVSVVIDTVKQIEAQLSMREYDIM
jgi:preprotein translocase subunit SecY